MTQTDPPTDSEFKCSYFMHKDFNIYIHIYGYSSQ